MLFPKMKELGPHLDAFAAHPNDHWKIAAGQVAQRLFVACDAVQLVCGGVCFLTLGLVLSRLKKDGGSGGRWMLLRILALSLAMGLLCYQLFVLAPRMNTNVRAYWTLAKMGEIENADRAEAAFAKDHPTATNVLGGTTAAVVVLIVGAACMHAGREE